MIDTVQTFAGSGGTSVIDWGVMWGNYVGWYLAGLVATFLYFWFIIRGGTADQDTFKEFFAIKRNQNTLYLHLVLYTGYILAWIFEGGQYPIVLVGEALKAGVGWTGIDVSKPVIDFSRYIATIMPQGELKFGAVVLGGGMTFLARNIIPAIWRKIKEWSKSKKV